MKNIKPFGPSIGRCKLTSRFIKKLNNEIDKKSNPKLKDYSAKLASQVKNEVKLSKVFIEKYLSKEIRKNIKQFLKNEKIKNVKKIKIINLWIVRQFKGEYNPIHYHEGDLSAVGYIKLPSNMTTNKLIKNKCVDLICIGKKFISEPNFLLKQMDKRLKKKLIPNQYKRCI